MNEDDKMRLLAAKFQFVLKDPYPEIAEWEMHEELRRAHAPFGWMGKKPKPEISAHKAWQAGFDFAWELIEKRVKEL